MGVETSTDNKAPNVAAPQPLTSESQGAREGKGFTSPSPLSPPTRRFNVKGLFNFDFSQWVIWGLVLLLGIDTINDVQTGFWGRFLLAIMFIVIATLLAQIVKEPKKGKNGKVS